MTVDGSCYHFSNSVRTVGWLLLIVRAGVFVFPRYNFTVDCSSYGISYRTLCFVDMFFLAVRNTMITAMMPVLQRVLVTVRIARKMF